jgi:hypothetical protein
VQKNPITAYFHTSVPEGNTNAPEADTNPPGANTNVPGADTNAPEGNTNVPGADTNAPEGNTNVPGAETNASEGDTNDSGVDTSDSEDANLASLTHPLHLHLRRKGNSRLGLCLHKPKCHHHRNGWSVKTRTMAEKILKYNIANIFPTFVSKNN